MEYESEIEKTKNIEKYQRFTRLNDTKIRAGINFSR